MSDRPAPEHATDITEDLVEEVALELLRFNRDAESEDDVAVRIIAAVLAGSRRRLSIIALALCLAGCHSAEEKKAEWIAYCVRGNFDAAQCDVLYSIKESSDKAARRAL